ncbi:MAG: organoarsenical effux MFS transporter ArsJ [Gammaproteobacteria bacterium]|nr:organoarsenical effux MFS transporter ArsJ [Gammaproteobacteria bacterium]
MFSQRSAQVRQYLLVTGNYWVFTLTDGALRMLVVLYFHQLGYDALQIALLFILYELFGVITNLLGGYLGALLGLNRTMNLGLFLQILALSMLLVPEATLTMTWVMCAQALSGIAKDLNKMSAKSAIKSLLPSEAQTTLFRWVALLTGSKNTLKGIGFFLGGSLLMAVGFQGAIAIMLGALVVVWLLSLWRLKKDLGRSKSRPKFKQLLSKSRAINQLSAARMMLFGARDIWFVIALPVYLSQQAQWDHQQIGGILAIWVIGYGLMQSLTPWLTARRHGRHPQGKDALLWVSVLTAIPALMAFTMNEANHPLPGLLLGLGIFGLVFAINSSIHSYLIVSYAATDGTSLDVGFYYMANAAGRLLGTLLSGWVFLQGGLVACLYLSTAMLLMASLTSIGLPSTKTQAY